MEIIHTLDKVSCVMAIRNFIIRRGSPLCFYSDNGTNFIAAAKEFNIPDLQSEFTHIKWQFNAPAMPNAGGCWERLIRSVKNSLNHSLQYKVLTDELLRSSLLEAEWIVNSRPLTYIPVSEDNPEALTPNHFLLGSSGGVKPMVPLIDDGVHLRRTWLESQQIADAFWKRFNREYLPDLTRRTKWFQKTEPIKEGDIVVTVDETHRNGWRLGRIKEVLRSKTSDQIRQAIVTTSKGTIRRPASKIAVLDVQS